MLGLGDPYTADVVEAGRMHFKLFVEDVQWAEPYAPTATERLIICGLSNTDICLDLNQDGMLECFDAAGSVKCDQMTLVLAKGEEELCEVSMSRQTILNGAQLEVDMQPYIKSIRLLAVKDDADEGGVGLVLPPASDADSFGEVGSGGDLSASNSGQATPIGFDLHGLLSVTVESTENVPPCDARPNRGGPPSPFVVLSFGRKTFKTKVVQRCDHPVWNETLYLPVSKKELGYSLMVSLYDYRSLSLNAMLGNGLVFPEQFVSEPNKRLELGLPIRSNNGKEITLRLSGKFIPVDDLKRTFWQALCRQFDQNENGGLNFVELELMLNCIAPDLSDQVTRLISERLGTIGGTTGFTYDEVAEALAFMMPSPGPSAAVHIGECPICTKIFDAKFGPHDILVHVAVCRERDASGKLQGIMMGGFLTEEQASRKWLSKLFSFVGYGGYQLGKNNGNIFVQDRITGKVIEEKMPAYIRLGIRLLYQTTGSRADTKMIRKILQSMTIRQGRKFSSLESCKSIPSFVKFHHLDTEEILDPLDSFRSFNEFFYRRLKPDARPCASTAESVALCPADCRLTTFPTISKATRLWIKGANFSVSSLLKDDQLGQYFEGGSLAICRLAPQDYHRFHCPFEAAVNLAYHIPGAYFTVNPMAIRQRLDVFTENARTVLLLDSPIFGKVAYVAIGAMMVGSIQLTCHPGDRLKRTDEVGYFAFGGSTIVLIFAKDRIRFDSDLLENSGEALETLVRVGQTLGSS